MAGEQLGVPSVSIMTEKFGSAAEVMRQALGAPDHGFVVIPHPISSATLEELGVVARRAADDVVRHLVGEG